MHQEIEAFISYISLEKNYASHTSAAYQRDLSSFAEYCTSQMGVFAFEEVHYSHIRSWIVVLVQQQVSNRTINRKTSSLNSFFKYLQKIELIENNPLKGHKSLKVEKKLQIPFSEKEMKAVFCAMEDEEGFNSLQDRLIVEMLYSTGIRRQELIDLKIIDVDLSKGTLKVLGKRNKERIIPLLGSVRKTLKVYLGERKLDPNKFPYLFYTSKKNKLYPTLVYRIINNYFSRVSSKVKKSPHVLRHTFATHMLNEGADLNSVKELLGHSSLASTQVYTHSSIAKLKEVYNSAHPRSAKK